MLNGGLERRKVDLDFCLHRVFRKQSFRPLQREVITAAIEGHDVFLQASTSFGKSLCFQLPAVLSHGVTVVVCPLLALMTDQVNALQALGVAVSTINSTTPLAERRLIIDDLLSGHPRTRVLYVTPELCQTVAFRRTLQTMHSQGELIRIAIDEAHCISEWGHDFRPAYKQLSWFRHHLTEPPVPISAFTATATPRVRADIINILGLEPARLMLFNTPSARPNIHYEIRYLEDFAEDPLEIEDFQLNDLHSWLKSIRTRREARLDAKDAVLPPIFGIVYVPYRVIAEQLATALTKVPDGSIRAVAYHAGLSSEDRNRVQTEWTASRPLAAEEGPHPSFYIIVATNAFGMGIDNPHVRFVVHWTPPRSFEGLVQESGRAGRDGRAAASLIYYNTQERDRVLDRLYKDVQNAKIRAGIKGDNSNENPNSSTKAVHNLQSHSARLQSFKQVIRYCETVTQCRHELIKDFFGDQELEMMGSQVAGRNVKTEGATTSPCDFACDFCKYGTVELRKRKASMPPPSDPSAFMDRSLVQILQRMFSDLH
ncbi:putative RecQ family helicase RecQ [Aspergillus novofumigatus IBT 16806]|uniref:ATP-dependent DNA helicase n=1 Tax=Aspergillus novofumigatus (strain IBT 16806) TaxID=1392255 RepID=A0A2I1C629_ASPN1|nr:putative RecQ family helicase RecQ [Aspergillus novofumigatus IBT 16806]PKX93082.1 putative RecQ family helicase RecQ [Aspergillus novofumigatus IBT 16806]